MKFDEQNLIINNVLTPEEIEEVYWLISKNNDRNYLMKTFTQNISEFDIPYRIAKKIVAHAEDISGIYGLEIEEYQFARYKKTVDPETGETLHPKLTPHCDLTFRQPRFTFDYQIKSNTSWPLVVEGKEFDLKDNQALTFSGTHQVHWRKPKVFQDHEFVDMIFFHLRKRNDQQYDDSVVKIVQDKIDSFSIDYQKEVEVILGGTK